MNFYANSYSCYLYYLTLLLTMTSLRTLLVGVHGKRTYGKPRRSGSLRLVSTRCDQCCSEHLTVTHWIAVSRDFVRVPSTSIARHILFESLISVTMIMSFTNLQDKTL